MHHPKTVKVKCDGPENELGYKLINEDDLNDSHELFEEGEAKPARARKNKGEQAE